METFQRREKIKLEILEKHEEKEQFHQDIELLYVLSGHLDVYIEGNKTSMNSEDVFIINANKRHYLKGSGDIVYVKLMIMYNMLSDVLNNFEMMFVCDSSQVDHEAYDGLRKLMQKLLGCYVAHKGDKADFGYIATCYEIMDYICKYFLIRSNAIVGDADSDKYRKRLMQIENYIQANYQSPISLKELADKLYLSNGYLSRFFKKNYGMSFAEYLTNVRLHHAVDQLLYTDIPITRIVYDNGFASVALFNKAFKKEYGETPSAVRKRAAKNTSQEQVNLSSQLEQKLTYVLWNDTKKQDDGLKSKKIQVTLSTNNGTVLKPIWNNIINIGSADDLLRSEVQEHTLLLKKTLNFTYVRFWNPFSKELLIDIENKEHKYNFSRLDSLLDFLVNNHIRPFIELENKPKRVEKTTTSSAIYELFKIIGSMDNWNALMESFLRHIVARYGREEVSSWRFELWLDSEQLDDELYLFNYFEKLKAARRIIHNYSDAKLGGSGIHGYVKSTEKKSTYIRAYHDKIKTAGAIPDFITLYSYAYDAYEENGQMISKPSSDQDFMLHVINNFERDVSDKISGREVYFSEWNLTISDRNLINDTCFKGAYLMKNYIDLLGKVDGMAYFRGTDRVSEAYDTDDFLFGGMGLLTKDGIQKPMMYALHFLNRLYPTYIGKGDNFIATKDGYGSYGIACHNCKKLNYHYYYVEEDSLDRNHLSKYFEDLDDLELNIDLTDVENGLYQMKVYRINEEHGSVMTIWQEMEFETNLSRDDIQYIKNACEPKLLMQKVKAEDNKIHLHMTLMANEIAFIYLMRL
ncbi:GH39 family glycosyl hydrolase [Sharpea azabuensis]|uniref:GH39 family glycosyl hydrolase n=1 Tax=Sharpea azabuensis TaxID=322505 RepID=UPI0013DD4689|nr:helix-turn-helix domain-containing protein [Sharpea azabuensis]